MGDQSPRASGLWLSPESKLTIPRAKRLLDSAEQAQALWAAKKACVLGGSPDPPEKLLLSSPGAASFQGSPHSLDDSGHDDLVASSASKYDDVAISLDTTRCFGDSELDDSLLEWSHDEEENSLLSCTEEEIQEILADDCMESEQYLTSKGSLSQNVNGESELDESGCTGTSVTSEETSVAWEIAGKPKAPLSRGSSSACSEELGDESGSLGENHLQAAQVTRMLFDLDVQELLSLSPIDADCADQPLEDTCMEEAKGEASEAMASDCPECDPTASGCDLEDSLEHPVSNGQENLAVDGLEDAPSGSRDVSDVEGDCVESSLSFPDLSCGQRTAEESSAPVLPGCPTSSGSRNQELSKATKSSFPWKSTSSGPSEELSDTALGQTGQEETTSGKEPVEVISVPHEEEERNYPRSSKKPSQGLHSG